MANLIPPAAKKAVIIEYWIRVVTVWLCLIGLAVVIMVCLQAPTMVLVNAQLQAYSEKYSAAIDRSNEFEAAQESIAEANTLATLLVEESDPVRLTELRAILDELAGDDVEVTGFVFVTEADALAPITVRGIADTRSALALFAEAVEEHALFAQAELPISNLARDRDITFSITIEPAVVDE